MLEMAEANGLPFDVASNWEALGDLRRSVPPPCRLPYDWGALPDDIVQIILGILQKWTLEYWVDISPKLTHTQWGVTDIDIPSTFWEQDEMFGFESGRWSAPDFVNQIHYGDRIEVLIPKSEMGSDFGFGSLTRLRRKSDHHTLNEVLTTCFKVFHHRNQKSGRKIKPSHFRKFKYMRRIPSQAESRAWQREFPISAYNTPLIQNFGQLIPRPYYQ